MLGCVGQLPGSPRSPHPVHPTGHPATVCKLQAIKQLQQALDKEEVSCSILDQVYTHGAGSVLGAPALLPTPRPTCTSPYARGSSSLPAHAGPLATFPCRPWRRRSTWGPAWRGCRALKAPAAASSKLASTCAACCIAAAALLRCGEGLRHASASRHPRADFGGCCLLLVAIRPSSDAAPLQAGECCPAGMQQAGMQCGPYLSVVLVDQLQPVAAHAGPSPAAPLLAALCPPPATQLGPGLHDPRRRCLFSL